MSKIKAKLVLKKIGENLRTKGKRAGSVSAAMKEVGYSPAYAQHPDQFTKTKVWKDLMKEYLPDELLTKRHNELLNAAGIDHYLFPKLSDERKKRGAEKKELTNDEIRTIVESVPGCRLIYVKRDFQGAWAFYQAPDNKSRKEGIDMAYKLSGKYAPDRIELTKRKFEHLTNAELAAVIKKTKDFLLKR